MTSKREIAEKRAALGCTNCSDCLKDPDTNCDECDCLNCCHCCFETGCSIRIAS